MCHLCCKTISEIFVHVTNKSLLCKNFRNCICSHRKWEPVFILVRMNFIRRLMVFRFCRDIFNSLMNALSFDKDDAFFIYGVKDIKTTYKEKQ